MDVVVAELLDGTTVPVGGRDVDGRLGLFARDPGLLDRGLGLRLPSHLRPIRQDQPHRRSQHTQTSHDQ